MIVLPMLSNKILVVAIFISSLTGCSPASESTNQPIDAINKIRRSLELPELPLEFAANAGMANSPSGQLPVANYQDSEGRIYSVDTNTNRVVEIDAREILPNISPDAAALPAEEIKARAMTFAKAVVADFDSRQSSLQYEEGGKVDNYFFSWYGEMHPGSMNRPFLQFGFHKSGVLFAYYNTLSVEE